VALFGPMDGEYYLEVEVGEANNQYNLFVVVEEPKGDSFTAVLPLLNSQTGEVLGEYEVAVTLSPREKATTTVLRTATARITQRTRLYDVSAQVSLPSIDVDASCEALEVATREIVRAAQGPKPTATPPPNDALAGARSIAAGETVRTTTRGAVLLPEAPLIAARIAALCDADHTTELPLAKYGRYLVGCNPSPGKQRPAKSTLQRGEACPAPAPPTRTT
jgi:hypothetical protein